MYEQQQQRRLEGVAGLLANQGRYGDSMLVHMNPREVQGLASMSPTGSLTVNPETGQPEAFLPFLIPLLGSLGGSAALTGLGATAAGIGAGGVATAATAGLSSAAAGAIGSGLASWAATGDLKQGLVSGITGFGIGSALGGIGAAGKEGIETGLETGLKGGVEGLGEIPVTLNPEQLALADSFKDLGLQQASMSLPQAGADPLFRAQMRGMTSAPWAEGTFGERVGDMFSKEGIAALTSPQALIPAAVAEGYNAEMVAEEAMRKWDKASGEMSEAELARQEEAIVANQFNPNLTPAPYNPGGTDYGAQYANAGGIVSLDPSDFRRRFNGLMKMGGPIVGMLGGGTFPGGDFGNMVGVGGYGSPFPAQQQAALRDPYSISPEQLQDVYAQQGMPGFGPEIMYFTPEKGVNPNPFKDWVPDPIAAPSEGGGEGGGEGSGAGTVNTTDEFIEIDLGQFGGIRRIPNPSYIPPEGVAESDAGTTTTPEAGSGLSAEDYANLYSQYMNYGSDLNIGNISPFKEGGETQVNADADRLIDLAAMAVLGELPEEEASVVVQAFIDEFGEEAFSTLRESVLEGIVPGSQKEGEIVGPGGGMDDQIMGMIGNQQPVAVSPGEYIVPADVVSGIGDGSTDAGVQELDGMLDRVRVERTNTTQQPRPLRKGGVLPR
jgi:hypothetical protein